MNSSTESEILARVLTALNAIPGVSTTEFISQPMVSSRQRYDATFTVMTLGGTRDYLAEVKSKLTSRTLDAALEQLHRQDDWAMPGELLLVADYLSDKLIDRLLKENIEFVDAAGNMHLKSEHFYILVRGRSEVPIWEPEAFTHTGLRIVYVLLALPHYVERTYREISEAANVSLASVSRTISSLLKQNYLDKDHSGAIRITNYPELMKRWELGYLETLRPRLGHTTWPITTEDRTNVLELLKGRSDVLVGGEEAADLLTSLAEPQTLTLHADPQAYTKLQTQFSSMLGGERSLQDTSSLHLLRTLTSQDRYTSARAQTDLSLVRPLLVRAELLAMGGERLREAATKLLHDVILPDVEQAQQ